jgi:putative transposase
MRPLRRILEGQIYFVTIRTVEERFALDPYACPESWILAENSPLDIDAKLAMRARGRVCVEKTAKLMRVIARNEQNPTRPRIMTPYADFTDSIPNIIGSVMARGLQLYSVELYGFVWMSNHGHLMLRANAAELAKFMAYLNGQVAANVNRFLGRRHQLWARRYAAAQVLDEAAELQMLGYLLANPQNAGIADSIDEWAGLSSAAFFFGKGEQRFLRFDRTNWQKQGRPADISPFLSTVVLEHKLLPQLERLNPNQISTLIRGAIEKHLPNAPVAGVPSEMASTFSTRRTLTARTVIPTDRPESSKGLPRKNSRQPLCHTTNPEYRKVFKEWHREFRIAYKASSEQYREGNTNVEFPPGSFAPSRYPIARYPSNLGANVKLNPTRENLQIAVALLSCAA